MIVKRSRDQRGPTDAGWLKSMHTFSFGQYYDPEHMGFGPLRVINDDRVIAGAGFQTHPHKNMEIISYVLSGELAHKDSMGNGSVIQKGEVQLMSAGTGVTHSEFNNSDSHGVHFLQIWIMPNVENTEPEYHQKQFASELPANRLTAVVTPEGLDGALKIKQDASLYMGMLEKGAKIARELSEQRIYWVHIAAGSVTVNGEKAFAGDGFSFRDEQSLTIVANETSEILLFDMAP